MERQDNLHAETIRRRVLREIDTYLDSYNPRRRGAIGVPWILEKVESGLSAMRAALVDPYWLEIARRDSLAQVHSPFPHTERCLVLAVDPKTGVLLAYAPSADEFLLAKRLDVNAESFGVVGDAVGCFLAI